MKRLLLVLALTGCHTSCDESTGAAPVVVPEAGPVLGAGTRIPATRPMMIHPITRVPPAPAASESSATP